MSSGVTPFGFLRNPAHRATSWREASGGNLLTSTQYVGLEWAYPVAREARTRVGLGLETLVSGRLCRTRADFEAVGLTCTYHSCLIFGFDWQLDGVRIAARYFLATDDALCVRVHVVNAAPTVRAVKLGLFGWANDQLSLAPTEAPAPWHLSGPPEVHSILYVVGGAEHPDRQQARPRVGSPASSGLASTSPSTACVARASRALMLDQDLAPGEERLLTAVLARGAEVAGALAAGEVALASSEGVYARLLAEDAAFYATCPTLSGDWPAGWREGLASDFETTRLLVQPARGIFRDVWPSWMAAWPRVVLAEGVLDMLRLAYADPALAQRAVLSMFRDAPQPNVPCVFEGGEFNMLAADGSRCGTSPAWCLPFLNLELLYLRTLDRQWLGQLFPYASAFLTWWLEHRVDAEGWLVYKCTWESGEDGNQRLDPTQSGDADISAHLRPVELQATLSHAAGVLAFFAAELDRPSEVAHWRAVEATYRDKTRQLFDAGSGRYRDWLIADAKFQEPCPDHPYWGVDPCRYSAQSLTPLLIGEPLEEAEVWRHAGPPWTLWPSWTLSLVESAAAAGLLEGVGRLAFETVDRVYQTTTRRNLGSTGNSRPLPGGAPEFWPLDWQLFEGHDAYGWGATTANLLIRHLFGFKESQQTDGWVAELAPALPDALLSSGRRFGIRRLNYRGLVFDLTYNCDANAAEFEVELDLGSAARACLVSRRDGAAEPLYASPQAKSVHTFHLKRGQVVTLRLNQWPPHLYT